MPRTEKASLEIIIPVFNEEEVLPTLLTRLRKVFSASAIQQEGLSSVVFLFVDDGSKDRSAETLAREIEAGNPFVLYRFSRNFGHQAAVSAGIAHSRADLVAIIDADLQDPPEVILEMVKVWRQGYDVVYGVRKKRKEGLLKRFCYASYYRLLQFLSDTEVAMDSGDFALMDRRVVAALQALPERVRYPRGLRSWVGFKQTGFPYERDGREMGVSKYSWRKLYQLATEGIISTSTRPLKLTQWTASLFLVFMLIFSGLILSRLVLREKYDKSTLMFLVLCLLISVTGLVIMGALHILCGYVARMYLEIKGRPTYLVKEVIGQSQYSSERNVA